MRPDKAINPIPAHAAARAALGGLEGRTDSCSSPGAESADRGRTEVGCGRRRQGSGRVRASVVERVDGPTLTGFVGGAGALATSLSTYGSHARIGQTDRLCQFGCGILNACRSLIAWLTALVSSRLGGCPVFASAASWSPLRVKDFSHHRPPSHTLQIWCSAC